MARLAGQHTDIADLAKMTDAELGAALNAAKCAWDKHDDAVIRFLKQLPFSEGDRGLRSFYAELLDWLGGSD